MSWQEGTITPVPATFYRASPLEEWGMTALAMKRWELPMSAAGVLVRLMQHAGFTVAPINLLSENNVPATPAVIRRNITLVRRRVLPDRRGAIRADRARGYFMDPKVALDLQGQLFGMVTGF